MFTVCLVYIMCNVWKTRGGVIAEPPIQSNLCSSLFSLLLLSSAPVCNQFHIFISMSKSISLTTFTPTEDELAAARTLLKHADAKSKKTKGNAMDVFLKTNSAGDGNVAILSLPKSERVGA